MREILFRGKAINRNKGYHRTKYTNGDWVYGLITRLYDEQFENLPAEMTNEYGISGIEIDHSTIGQYTGLTDKTGKKIFEGDILAIGENEQQYQTVSVGYKNGAFRVSHYAINLLECRNVETEVIGNIYDNPELLRTPQNDEVRE